MRRGRSTRRDETGQVLLMALGFLTFVGVISVSLLSYATTNVRATVSLRQLRATEFAADGAVEGAINKLRNTVPPSCGANYFVATSSGLNNQPVVVDCAVIPGPLLEATFTARCPPAPPATSPCGPADSIILSAKVKFRPAVPSVITEVESWSLAT
jgi:Tfp pilus assembly protein PilX